VSPERFAEALAVAADLRSRLRGRTVWNINSTARGGGVAEMLRYLVAYARGTGVDCRWAVIEGSPDFFRITKRLHNALHGVVGDGSDLALSEREIYEEISRINATALCAAVVPGDVVILHDPQTAGLVPALVDHGAKVIWRCHIGHDRDGAEVERGWSFLAPYLDRAHRTVFSRRSYIPDCCDHGRSVIITPSIDPFSPKNQEMDAETVRAILTHTGLIERSARDSHADAPAARTFVRDDGSPGRVERPVEVLRLGHAPSPDSPLIVQVSRWDALKDPIGVIDGFVRYLEIAGPPPAGEPHLVLAGPNVRAVADDPEGAEVYAQVESHWRALTPEIQMRVHLASLPMDDIEENAAIVNALQRHAAVIVQKSLHEGFGLTVTEAMWKARPIVASAVGGIQDQIEDGKDGLLLACPADVDEFAAALARVFADPIAAENMALSARETVRDRFLGLTSLLAYGRLLVALDEQRDA